MTLPMIRHDLNHDNGIFIHGIADLHVGSQEFNEPQFQRLSREILSAPNHYIVLVGDLIDNALKTSVSDTYKATMSPRDQRHYAVEILHPLKDRILAMVSGNHERRTAIAADFDPSEVIADDLGIHDRYREGMAFASIRIGERTSGSHRPPNYCVCITHGTSGGQLIGAGLNSADKLAMVNGADLTIFGHSHKPAVAPSARLECIHAQNRMVMRHYAIMVCTAWLDYGGYPMQKAYKPLPIAPNRAWLQANQFGMELYQRV